MSHASKRFRGRSAQVAAIGLALGVSLGVVAVAVGVTGGQTDSKGRPLDEIPDSTPLDASEYETSIAVGQTATSDRLGQILDLYNSGDANYLDLPLEVDDPTEARGAFTLEALVDYAEVAFVGRVTGIRWERDPILDSMKVVQYELPSQIAFGTFPVGKEVHGRMTGPSTDFPTTYSLLEYGVREEVGETYLVFAQNQGRFYSAPNQGGFILVDGDRIAKSEAAKELGIEGKKVSEVVDELRRLKAAAP